MVTLFITAALTFAPGDKIVWGDKITNASDAELNDTYACKGLVIKQDGKLLHVKGMCQVAMVKDKKTGQIIYIPFAIDDYLTIDDVKGKQ